MHSPSPFIVVHIIDYSPILEKALPQVQDLTNVILFHVERTRVILNLRLFPCLSPFVLFSGKKDRCLNG